MNTHRFAALAAVCLVVVGCTSTSAPVGTAPLEGTHWTLVELAGEPVELEEGDKAPYLVLDAATHRIAGDGGVNSFGGEYRLEDGAARLGPLVSTRRAGPPAAMGRESVLFIALERATAWRVRGRSLELVEDGALLARFEADGAR